MPQLMKTRLIIILALPVFAALGALGQGAVSSGQAKADLPTGPMREGIGLNFIRPDANRPDNYGFVHSGEWLVSQYAKLGVKWNRLAFSWVVIQPDRIRYDWSTYDQIVNACQENGIEILATLRQVDLWGIIAGDRKWRKSAYVLQKLLK